MNKLCKKCRLIFSKAGIRGGSSVTGAAKKKAGKRGGKSRSSAKKAAAQANIAKAREAQHGGDETKVL